MSLMFIFSLQNIVARDVQIPQTYRQRVKEYVPFYKVKEKGKKEWFNGKCERVKKRRDKAW